MGGGLRQQARNPRNPGQHIGPHLQFAPAEVIKFTAEGSESPSARWASKPVQLKTSRDGDSGWAVSRDTLQSLGEEVEGVGDINDDGKNDSWWGPGKEFRGRIGSGSVYLIYGGREGRFVDVADLGRGGYRIGGARQYDLIATGL